MSDALPKLYKLDELATLSTARLHANAVSMNGKGLLIIGAPQAGKTRLTLSLLQLNPLNILIADDQVILKKSDNSVLASAPKRLQGMISDREGTISHLAHKQNIPISTIIYLITEPPFANDKSFITIFGSRLPLRYLSLEAALGLNGDF